MGLDSDLYYTPDELRGFGFTAVGDNVTVSRLVRFYGVSGRIGDHVRVDDYCVFKGKVSIGSFVHVSSFCIISGVAGEVSLGDLSTLAARVSIYSGSDDYSSEYLTNSMVPARFKRTISGDVTLARGVIVGAHSVVLPKTTLGEFASVGACCIVKGRIESGSVLVAPGARPQQVSTRDVARLGAMADDLISQWRRGELQP